MGSLGVGVVFGEGPAMGTTSGGGGAALPGEGFSWLGENIAAPPGLLVPLIFCIILCMWRMSLPAGGAGSFSSCLGEVFYRWEPKEPLDAGIFMGVPFIFATDAPFPPSPSSFSPPHCLYLTTQSISQSTRACGSAAGGLVVPRGAAAWCSAPTRCPSTPHPRPCLPSPRVSLN